MRFSVLHLLLLGTALAAPIQDLEQASKRAEENSLIARGLVPILPRIPAFVPPKPIKPPVNGPDAPVSPKPPVGGPDAPTTPDTPAPLRPNPDPAKPPTDTPENPGLIPNDDPKPKPPATDPDVPVRPNDPDAPATQPESCVLKRCVGPYEPLAGAPESWKTGGVDYPEKGFKTHKTLDKVNAGEQEANPRFTGDLTDNGRYVRNIKPDSKAPDREYLKDPRWKDAFAQDQKFSETEILNRQTQLDEFNNWKNGDFADQLRRQGASEDDIFMAQLSQDLDGAAMVRTLENPEKGSVVVKASFNNEKDLYRKYTGEVGENPATGRPYTYERPGFGNKAEEVGWTDQLMANWRKSAADAGVDVKSLKYIAQDDITRHTATQQVIDGVMEVMEGRVGTMLTVRRTGGSAKETASFDALAGTVHGQRPIQMATDHHVELGNPTVDAFHVLKSADGRYDMVIEFGHAAPTA
ncbi:hypothetical protein K458DRAFT_390993 [Lentithecium fluviatile CBS 122367]|uniref:ADP-ribosylation n=1 Tax=Lentithecium fluviatile CBS 122367 TaxID=1168545 RepID=A0A6G1IW79_9PLEO|nr:hypothetical protein K458DRAFT_390993 [Lentithecium fluviatile CBS 122367]